MKKPMKKILSYLIIVLGNLGIAFAIEFFIAPNEIVTGGVAGVGLLVRFLTNDAIPLSVLTFAINSVLLVIGFIFMGKKFALASLLSSILYPSLMAGFELIFKDGIPKLTDNTLLASIYAGVIFGGSLGIVFREGVSTGGFDIPEMIIHKRTGISMSVLTYSFDFVILITQLILGRPLEGVMYGIMMTFISSFTIDKVMMLGDRKVQMKIISEKYEEIRNYIVYKRDKGVTVLYGETGYLKEPVHMLLTVMSKREALSIRKAIEEIDPCAFIASSYITEVDGRGFTLDKHYNEPKAVIEKAKEN